MFINPALQSVYQLSQIITAWEGACLTQDLSFYRAHPLGADHLTEALNGLRRTLGTSMGRLVTSQHTGLANLRTSLSDHVGGQVPITAEGILQAHQTIRASFQEGLRAAVGIKPVGEPQYVKTTSLEPSEFLSKQLGRRVFLKREDQQIRNSFKIRGATNLATNFILSAILNSGQRPEDLTIACASHGNHALGVVQAAYNLGVKKVDLYLPMNASPIKIKQLEELNANVILVGTNDSDATFEHAERDVKARAKGDPTYLFIPAFDHAMVSMGQGTIGVEIGLQLAAQGYKSDYSVIVPAGGGGLIAGIATFLSPLGIHVYGAESTTHPHISESLKAGRVVAPHEDEIVHRDTIADGIALIRIGDVTFPNIQRHVRGVATVSEAQLAEGIRLFYQHGVKAEGAAAAPLAALLDSQLPIPKNHPLVLVFTGSNIDEPDFQRIINPAS